MPSFRDLPTDLQLKILEKIDDKELESQLNKYKIQYNFIKYGWEINNYPKEKAEKELNDLRSIIEGINLKRKSNIEKIMLKKDDLSKFVLKLKNNL